jgi:ORF6N domain
MQNPPMAKGKSVIPIERIATRIYLIRGEKVMLDSDLAELYDVRTSALNQQVTRNMDRFPEDFAFRLAAEEFEALMSQIVTSNPGRGGRRKLPMVFTEQGVAMLSSVLRSKRAAQANVAIMRTFVRLREILATHKDLARKVEEHDRKITLLIEAVQKILAPQSPPKRNPIGYVPPKD